MALQSKKKVKSSVAQKFDTEKIRMDLLPPLALNEIAKVFTFGAQKYSAWNWSNGIDQSRLFGALQRHLNAWQRGEELDPESGEPHLSHAGCCMLMLMETALLRKDLDDRPTHYKTIKNLKPNNARYRDPASIR